MKTQDQSQRTEKGQKRSLHFKNLSPKQKRLLEASALGVSGIAFGAMAVAMMGFTSKSSSDGDGDGATPPNAGRNTDQGGQDAEISIFTTAPFCEKVTDDMSFSEAFSTARTDVGDGGFFVWNGQTYNTYYKEEWEAMTEEQQNEFNDSVDYTKAAEEGDLVNHDEIIDILNDEVEEEQGPDVEDIVILDDDEELEDVDDIVIIGPDKDQEEVEDIVVIDPNSEESSDEETGAENGDFDDYDDGFEIS